ncbi:MAG: sugar phosphate isomerase/epimerase family protein [Anaerolineae bacterium]
MIIGCNALYPGGDFTSRELFTPAAYGRALANLAEAGFAAVEYSHLHHFSVDEAAAVGEHARLLGLECWSCHAEGPQEFDLAGTAAEARAALLHCLDLCAAVGAKVVVLHTPFGPARPDLSREADVLAALDADRGIVEPACRRAEALGLKIALENFYTLAHRRYIGRLRDLIGAECLGFCVDTGHAALGDLGPARAVRLAGDRLYTTHLQDNLGSRDDHLPPGQGGIDWDGTFAALRDVGYRGTLMLELTDCAEDRPYDQRLELAQGAANVKRLAERYLGGG